jgi:hypothetical protein
VHESSLAPTGISKEVDNGSAGYLRTPVRGVTPAVSADFDEEFSGSDTTSCTSRPLGVMNVNVME